MAFVVSSLTDYVQNNREIILKDIALGADSIQRMTIQPGVKKNAELNLLAVAPAFQDGSSCGWNASGDATFTKRVIETGAIKINMAFCDKTLLGKWTEYVVRFGANNSEFPFEAYLMDAIRKEIKKEMEKEVWQNVKSSGALFDGLLTIINSASGTIKETIASGATAYEAIYQVYMAIPEEILGHEDLTINVSPKVFRAFCKEITDMNLYHFAAGEELNEIILPGTSVKVKCVRGLADGTSTHNERKIVATYDKNLFFGTDMMSDSEELKGWYSEDNDEFRIKASWNAGVQVAFPDFIVLGTMSADPALTAPQSVGIAAISSGVTKLASAVNSSNQIDTLDHSGDSAQ